MPEFSLCNVKHTNGYQNNKLVDKLVNKQVYKLVHKNPMFAKHAQIGGTYVVEHCLCLYKC